MEQSCFLSVIIYNEINDLKHKLNIELQKFYDKKFPTANLMVVLAGGGWGRVGEGRDSYLESNKK